jgi:hypothetical protein
MKMSPSQRSSEDMKRLKARAARRGLSPGPGAYDPRMIGSTSLDLTGHFAFRSMAKRGDPMGYMLNEQGDPGAYDSQIYLSLARQASSSWNSSATSACAIQCQSHAHLLRRAARETATPRERARAASPT